MTDTEKILNLIEINEDFPCTVLDESNVIISSNNKWMKDFGTTEIGKNFTNLFDTNTKLLVENSLIDVNAFNKVQRRTVKIKINGELSTFRLLLSPFILNARTYVYVILYNEQNLKDIFVYPSSDDKDTTIKYNDIIKIFKNTSEPDEQGSKSLQEQLDMSKTSILIKENEKFLSYNKVFIDQFGIEENESISDKLLPKRLIELIKFAEFELKSILSLFVIEETDYATAGTPESGKIIIYPLSSKNVDKFLIVGTLQKITKNASIERYSNSKKENSSDNQTEFINVDELNEPTIVYDKNDFDILNANYRPLSAEDR